jgi:hypothetical protein
MDNDLSPLIACKLDMVLDMLKNNNYKTELVETAPPGNKKGTGAKRVLSIRNNSGIVKIIWSYESYV